MTTNVNVNETLIGKYLNRYGYSDVDPIGKIICIKGKTTVIVKRVEATEQTTKLDFHVGGFSTYCSNQFAQRWTMVETDETFEVRLGKGYLKRVKIEDEPRKYYDYNF